jgi:sec-independent protein translocase protein TatA
MNLGWTELLLIFGVALLMFGPSRLPGLGKSMGEAIRGFKKGISEDSDDRLKQVKQQLEQGESDSLIKDAEKTEKNDHKLS